jgi:outer membrane protein TolC
MLDRSLNPLRRCGAITLATLALMLACTAARAQTAGALEFDEALRLAEARSRSLTAQEASATAAREMAVAAGRSPDPVLKFGINNLPIDGPDRFSVGRDFMTMRSVALSQEFTRADKRAARATRFEREADVALAGRAMVLANLQRDTALAWFERHYRERQRELLRAQRVEAALQIETAETAYRTSRGSQADVFAARSAAAQIDDRAAQSERELATATTQLARWVGDAARAPLGTPPCIDTVALDAAGLDDELAHHPRIAMLGKQEDAARADAEIARAQQRADWSAEVMVSQRGSAYSNMISINLSIPLQWDAKNRQDRELAAKLATTEQLRAQRDEALREHVAEVTAMLQEWRSDRERLQRYDAALLPLAAERTRAALAGYRAGSSMLGAVLEARRAEIDTRIERLKLELEAARLWVQLTYLSPARSTP